MKPNTSKDEHKTTMGICKQCKLYGCINIKLKLCNYCEEAIEQGYAKALTKILKRLRYRQAKITNLWINTRLKEYEYAKMVLEEEITLIAKLKEAN